MPETETQCCLIRHPKEEKVLLRRCDNLLDWPRVERTASWFIGNRVGEINDAIARDAGLQTVVLRECPHRALLLCELEVLDDEPEPVGGHEFFGLEDIRRERFVDRRDYFFLRDGWNDLAVEPPADGLVAWERPGWFAGASTWIRDHVPAARIRQVKGAWEWSSLLTVEHGDDTLYFKADGRDCPGEAVILDILHSRHPGRVPEPVAIDRPRNWTLMKRFADPLDSDGMRRIDDFSDLHATEAPAAFSELQLAESEHVDEWLEAGMSDLRPRQLPALYDLLIADDGALGFGNRDGLREGDRIDLEDLKPRLERLCTELDDSPLAATLVNQDFRPGNVTSGPLVFDWSDTVIGHPLFSLRRYLDFVRPEPGEEDRARELSNRILEAHLRPWKSAFGDDAVDHDWDLVNRLRLPWMALRWWRELPRLHHHTPWGAFVRSAVPACLKAWIDD